MGRWRPPAAKSSPYISEAGFEALQGELRDLWPKRREVVKALAEAAAEGDRSENAEYIYRKKELAGIDRRIRYLQKRLPALKVVREYSSGDAAYFGASVTVRYDTGQTKTYRIVGADEADARSRRISIDSALARGMLGKRVDDDIEVRTSDKVLRMSIVTVEYP